MLHRYEGKKIRVTTEDGEVITGIAESLPSGYGLHEFDRAEESVQLGDVLLFKSDVRKIEIPGDPEGGEPETYGELMADLLEKPYWIVDILPEQVPENADGQYFSVERYFLRPARRGALRRRYAELLLRLNCYEDMAVSFDSCVTWEKNPDPETFAAALEKMTGNAFLRAVFPARRAMIDMEPDDTSLTVYDPDGELLGMVRKLAAAGGFFVWSPPGGPE